MGHLTRTYLYLPNLPFFYNFVNKSSSGGGRSHYAKSSPASSEHQDWRFGIQWMTWKGGGGEDEGRYKDILGVTKETNGCLEVDGWQVGIGAGRYWNLIVFQTC